MSLLLLFQSDAGSGVLAGTSSLTFTPAGTLLGSAGANTAAATITFTPAGLLKGAGATAGTSTLTFTPAASVHDECSPAFQPSAFQFDAFDMCQEVGTAASANMIFTPEATLLATGVLAGSAAFVFSPAAELTAGMPSGEANMTFSPAATLGGLATLDGTTALDFTLMGSGAAGTGVLVGNADLIFTPEAMAFLAGAMVASSDLFFTSAGSMLGVGAPPATTSLTFTPTGTLIGAAITQVVGTTGLIFVPTLQIAPDPAAHPIIPRMGELFDDETRDNRDRYRRKRWKRARNERNKLRRMLDAQYEGRPYVDEDDIEEQAVVVANLLSQALDLPFEDLAAIQDLIFQVQQMLLAKEIVKAELELALQLSREMLRAKDEEDAITALLLMG